MLQEFRKRLFGEEENMEYGNDLTYTSVSNPLVLQEQLKTLAWYVGALILWMLVATMYEKFGSSIISPGVEVIFVVGALSAWKLKEDRDNIIKETRLTVIGYLAFLFLYWFAIQKITPITSEDMSASLHITVPAVSGMSIAGMLQTMLMFVSIGTPLGFIIYIGKKYTIFNGKHTKEEALERYRHTRQHPRR